MKNMLTKKLLIIGITILISFVYFGITNKSHAAEVVGTWDISADDGESNVIATLYDNGNFVISGTGQMMDVYGSVNERPFNSRIDEIKKIEIKKGVTYIGQLAFYGCGNLTEITIPEGVTSIRFYSFSECNSLKKINIPNSVTSIEQGTFSNCSSLTEITIPSSVKSIEDNAFESCSSLTEINIPNSVTRIEERAFYECSSLTGIYIPNSVTSIGKDAFFNCSSLTEITIPSSVTSIEDNAFESCSSLIEITIPNSVTNIGNFVFTRCSSLRKITIQEGVTSIGYHAFNGCSSLIEITIPSTITSIEYYCFYNCSSLIEITIPEGVTSIGISAFGGCSNLTSINIPSSVTSIEENAFESCSNLTEITIPSSVTNIGNYVFTGCNNLTIYTSSDYVANYAKNNDIKYVLDKEPPTVKITAYKYNNDGSLGEEVKSAQTFSGNGIYTIPKWINYGVWFKLEATDDIKIKSNWKWNEDGVYEDLQEEYEGVAEDFENIDEKYKSITSPGWRKAQYTVIDALGNTSIVNIVAKIEKEVPELTIGEYTKEWTKENIILPIRAADNISGIVGVKVNGSIVDINNEQGTYTVTNNGTYTVEATDEAGNTDTKVIEINNIDKNAPVLSVEGNPSEWTKGEVTLKVNAKDEQSGLAEQAYSFDGGKTWQEENEKTYRDNTSNIVVKVRDKVGNIEENEPISITKIMKIQEIVIKQPADKTTYEEGEDFNAAGMKIEAVYDNGIREEKSNYQIDNGKNLQKGQTSVRISYIENEETKTVELPITVNEIEEELSVKIKEYETVKEDEDIYIENIKENTSIEELENNIKTNGTIEIYKGETKITDKNKKIGTGMEIRIKLGNEEVRLTAIVIGDITGDGKISIGDLSRLSRHIARIDTDLKGAYLRASDITKDGKYGKISDLLKMARVLAKMDTL